MSRPHYNRAHTNVSDWLDGQYEYMKPDHDVADDTKRHNPYVPKDVYQDTTPEPSEKSSPRDRGHRSHRDHKSSRDYHHRPITPPSEEELDRHRTRGRDRDREGHRSHRTSHSLSSKDAHDLDREDRRRPRHEKEARYPPKTDRGRPVRPPLSSVHTSPYMSRKEPKEKEESPERPHRSRRYSASSSPPRHRSDKSSRHDDRSSGHSSKRDRDTRSHHGGSSSSKTGSTTSSSKKPRRPSLSHTHTAPSGKSFSGGRSFSFLSDPRFAAAATAAFEAGATAAVGAVGSKNAGAKVARAALGAAALNAFRSPPPPEPEPAPAPADPLEARPGAKAGEVVGGYAADHLHHRKGSTRRRH